MQELVSPSMDPNERIKYFNQRFTTILNKFKDIENPIKKYSS